MDTTNTKTNFKERPVVVICMGTQSCDLTSVHGRAYAVTKDPSGQEICCFDQPAENVTEASEVEWAAGENG